VTPPPLVLAGHGSRDEEGAAAFRALVARLKGRLAPEGVEVAGGFIELSEPPLREAVAALASRGHRHLVAVPVVLSAASHAKGDIPASLARERARHPGVTWSYGRPLGPHPVLLGLLAERIATAFPLLAADAPSEADGAARAGGADGVGIADGTTGIGGGGSAEATTGIGGGGSAEATGGAGGGRSAEATGGVGRAGVAEAIGSVDAMGGAGSADPIGGAGGAAVADGAARPAVLLAARGTTDPDANAEVCKTARLLWEGRDYEFAETAFVSLAEPGIAAGLERCRRLGARQIIVARYFLFPGVLPDRVEEQARAYAAAHPELGVRVTDVLGDTDELAGLVTERYREALAGDIRMNCDTCAYRVALPGSVHLVGAAQRPHVHPAEDGHPGEHGHLGEHGHSHAHHGAGHQHAH
jgi:sirohydrochlorin ferrochelatase